MTAPGACACGGIAQAGWAGCKGLGGGATIIVGLLAVVGFEALIG